MLPRRQFTPPETGAGAVEPHRQQAELGIDLTCPVCLDAFNDPCFVCPNHHTLCRRCCQMVAEWSGARCPTCRQPLTRPIENAFIRALIESRGQGSGMTRQCPSGEPTSRLINVQLAGVVDKTEQLHLGAASGMRRILGSQDEEDEELDDVEEESDYEPSPPLKFAAGKPTIDSCTVRIFSVQLDASSEALAKPELDETKCYVSFRLPGFEMEDTVESVATPRPGKSQPNDFCLRFGFKKTFDYSFESSYQKRRQLAQHLMKDPIEIIFTVVCETNDPESDFYLDFCRASVRLDSLIARGQDIRKQSFPLILMENQQVGTIKISTNLPSLLLEIYNELSNAMKSAIKFQK